MSEMHSQLSTAIAENKSLKVRNNDLETELDMHSGENNSRFLNRGAKTAGTCCPPVCENCKDLITNASGVKLRKLKEESVRYKDELD